VFLWTLLWICASVVCVWLCVCGYEFVCFSYPSLCMIVCLLACVNYKLANVECGNEERIRIFKQYSNCNFYLSYHPSDWFFVIYGQFSSFKKDQVFLDFKIRCDIGMKVKMFELDVRSCLNILNTLEENFLWWSFIVILNISKLYIKCYSCQKPNWCIVV